MIRAVIFDMFETLITHFESPLYFSAQMAAEMYLPGEEHLPLATATGVFYTAHANK